MIILLHLDAGPRERAAVREALTGLGLSATEVRLGDRTALVAEGGDVPDGSVARLPHVDQVISTRARAPLAAATRQPGGRAVRLGPAIFGAGHFSVVAGPCTIEDRDTLREVAVSVRDAGAIALRGGAFKVRTSPHQFQGGGLEALRHMREVSREVGLPFFTELTDPRHVEQAGELLDGVQVGARHMQNFPLLLEVARLGKPIMLKRHMAADLEEFLLAVEYVLNAGNDQVILCERGIKTAERHVRYMLDVGAVPWLKDRIGLPVVVDPSHAAGHHALVSSLARAAVAAGADGVMIEVHPRPHETRCDALQALPPETFASLVDDLRRIAALFGRRLVDARTGGEPSLRAAAEA